jgi:hypothetical protein
MVCSVPILDGDQQRAQMLARRKAIEHMKDTVARDYSRSV